MATTGIKIDAGVVALFKDIQKNHTHKYAAFKIVNKIVVVEEELLGDPKRTETKEEDKECFDELVTKLTEEPRYIVYDFGFTNKEDRLIEKLAFIGWCPDDTNIKDKMNYSSTKDAIKKDFEGLSLEFQANSRGDMDYDSLAAEVERKA